MKDKYQIAVEYLTEHPGEIYRAYVVPSTHKKAGCLFRYCTPDGMPQKVAGNNCGCLVMVRHHGYFASTNRLTEEIRADERIPMDPNEIGVEHLEVFAEWQRRLDKELNRT